MSKDEAYILVATWNSSNGALQTRVIHSLASSRREMVEKFASERSEWIAPEDPESIGWINGNLVRVRVFKLHPQESCLSGLNAWNEWVEDKRKHRTQEIYERDKARDLEEIQRLVNKWGLSAMEVLAMASENEGT